MENSIAPADGFLGRSISEAEDLDLMDELLLESGFDCSDFLQQGSSSSLSPFGSSGFSPVFEINNDSPNPLLPENDNLDDTERLVFSTSLTSHDNQMLMSQAIQMNELVLKSPGPGYDSSMDWWFQPRGPIVSVRDRLIRALTYIKESQRDGDFLVQVWVPTRIGDRQVLTTCGQPFSLDVNCERLVNYRSVSMSYHFSADENSNEALGLPGRVFLGKVPEWTPDVRYFNSYEYPRINHAQRYDIRGTIALPIFEKDSRSCLGVLELIMTTQKINYSMELEKICNALQAVDFRSSGVLSIPHVRVSNDSYQAALPEIQEVLRAACHTHRLPLAQTWISCNQQGKRGSRHSDENYKDCISTVDQACYVQDPSMVGFQQACSEHHLFRGQGVAGKAFITNEPCFFPDITALSKIEYPLSHHAKLFCLRAAVAIRLRSINTGNADFVLEFFLPIDCIDGEEQKLILNSLSITIQQICQSLRVVTTKELEDEALSQANELFNRDIFFSKVIPGDDREPTSNSNLQVGTSDVGITEGVSSWITSIMEAQQKGERTVVRSCMPLQFSKQEEGFNVTTHWDPSKAVLPSGDIFSGFSHHQEDLFKDSTVYSSFPIEPSVSISEKASEKRRAKTEKTISLEDLRKHFAGSLKDAAKNLGVCPTTLKRICRQHGINRWPSRKIKKVGRSLRKLQVVIDSVHGREGTFHLSSLYENFTKDFQGSTSVSALKQNDQPESSKMTRLQEGRLSSHTSGSNSLSSSSCSQSSSSSPGCSSGIKQDGNAPQLTIKQEMTVENNQTGMCNKSLDHVEVSTEEKLDSLSQSQSHKPENRTAENLSHLPQKRQDYLKIKAIYEEEKVILKLQPSWGLQSLKEEIAKRFNIADAGSVNLKYLDDESEWVLLTCDADLQECIDVYKSSSTHTIKISVHHCAQPSITTSFGRTVLS
ncbi:protein NLP1-like isoform X1 [Typha angustifolia]|uniref:protein NLP1-like isoform X1 n=1 Tax=Typha angustifolia TaxID=59011 RepID=UPI003C2AAF8D